MLLLIAGIVHKRETKHQQKDIQTFGFNCCDLASYMMVVASKVVIVI
jgi:hypothetical protein